MTVTSSVGVTIPPTGGRCPSHGDVSKWLTYDQTKDRSETRENYWAWPYDYEVDR